MLQQATAPSKATFILSASYGPASSKVESSVSNSENQKISGEESKLNHIKEKTQCIIEVNIRGTPPADGLLQTWAAPAKDRPMPICTILYELSDLRELMGVKSKVFTDYIDYFLHIGDLNDRTILDALHYGVPQPYGIPISS